MNIHTIHRYPPQRRVSRIPAKFWYHLGTVLLVLAMAVVLWFVLTFSLSLDPRVWGNCSRVSDPALSLLISVIFDIFLQCLLRV